MEAQLFSVDRTSMLERLAQASTHLADLELEVPAGNRNDVGKINRLIFFLGSGYAERILKATPDIPRIVLPPNVPCFAVERIINFLVHGRVYLADLSEEDMDSFFGAAEVLEVRGLDEALRGWKERPPALDDRTVSEADTVLLDLDTDYRDCENTMAVEEDKENSTVAALSAVAVAGSLVRSASSRSDSSEVLRALARNGERLAEEAEAHMAKVDAALERSADDGLSGKALLDDSGVDIAAEDGDDDGADTDIDDEVDQEEPENGDAAEDIFDRGLRRAYSLRVRAHKIMGAAGKVWQCDLCDYWHYNRYGVKRHQRRVTHRGGIRPEERR